jgi:hypothetical protein
MELFVGRNFLNFINANYFNRCYRDDDQNMSLSYKLYSHTLSTLGLLSSYTYYISVMPKMFRWNCHTNIKMSLINT